MPVSGAATGDCRCRKTPRVRVASGRHGVGLFQRSFSATGGDFEGALSPCPPLLRGIQLLAASHRANFEGFFSQTLAQRQLPASRLSLRWKTGVCLVAFMQVPHLRANSTLPLFASTFHLGMFFPVLLLFYYPVSLCEPRETSDLEE